MSKPSLREDLLNAGRKVMFRSGYTAASVRDICEAAGVPLGSCASIYRCIFWFGFLFFAMRFASLPFIS